MAGQICDSHGNALPAGSAPDPDPSEPLFGDWFPFNDRRQFRMAEFLFRRNQMSAAHIDELMQLSTDPLYSNHKDPHQTIDKIPYGDVQWESGTITYEGPPAEGPRPSWMEKEYDIWYRNPLEVVKNLIKNPDFADEFDYAPYHEYVDGEHRFQHFMSGDWAWRQAVRLYSRMYLDCLNVHSSGYHWPRPQHERSHVCAYHSWE